MAVLASLLAVVVASPIPARNPRNATADAVVAESRTLGIEFGKDERTVEQRSNENVPALKRSGAGAWVDVQVEVDTDEIARPPASLRDFLQDRRDALGRVVSALERDEPDWGPDSDAEGTLLVPFLPILRLERVLMATALVEEHDGNPIDAARALEAAWALSRSISSRPGLIAQLASIGAEKLQIGALRKMRLPSSQWFGRLTSDGPWPRMLEAVAQEGRFPSSRRDDGAREGRPEMAGKALGAVAGALSAVSPCDLAVMTDEQIWMPADEALAAEPQAVRRAFRDLYTRHMAASIANALRRAARLELDREVTLRVLQLRLEKSDAPDGQWPKDLRESTSAVCPLARYAYESSAAGIELRFEGTIDVPRGMGPVLPLRFRGRNPGPTPTPRPAALTPSATGGMIAPP